MPDSSKPAVPELAIVVAPMVRLLPSIAHLLLHASRGLHLRLSSWPRECLMCSNSKMLLLLATSGQLDLEKWQISGGGSRNIGKQYVLWNDLTAPLVLTVKGVC